MSYLGVMLQKISSILEYHQFMRLPKPGHPQVSVVKFEDIRRLPEETFLNIMNDFYSIGLKRNFDAKMKYGAQQYDFNGGMMTFMAPGQQLSIEVEDGRELNHSGWLLLVHPDFLLNTALASKIQQYDYFSYAVNEALHLSQEEEDVVTGIMQNIDREYHAPGDEFSKPVIISQLESLLIYAERFYQRQFITRKAANHEILDRLEHTLTDYFNSEALEKQGMPSVAYLAEQLHLSAGYLGAVLRLLTGRNTQQHIHDKLIHKAKEKLSGTSLSISEIAYELGFEYPQSFSKLFKSKTNLSPQEFRNAVQ
jgi:AraC family transcriptional regulator, transcriptional activator of pobA